MIEETVDIATRDGTMTTFICHPERGGPHPVIIIYMDAPGIREELRDMARRLGTAGYYVVLPNMYYRSGEMELGPIGAEGSPERAKMFALMNSITIPMVMDDTAAILDLVAGRAAASPGPIGCMGYCMSGTYAVNAAARFPDRVAAAASIYGANLVTEADDSPHKVAGRAKAELYFACAEIDIWAPPETVAALQTALDASGANVELEIYPGVHHGFAFPLRPIYDKPAAERHWERLLALFRRRLA
ncbi:MAG: dienelactone hydrolase family protein [Phenylobacterium sp.]|uniref:dienelactone hydrolase family protein n=1 Tax=Phenylobacterium sp. TaxID=1871053 RepID=UPI0027359BCA|nr:dienelactone hydrolase family protein [Phenylobacterium sp.]MDP3174119.1 dienelactone hydrolase family protein [Phenylobacterium sp.]